MKAKNIALNTPTTLGYEKLLSLANPSLKFLDKLTIVSELAELKHKGIFKQSVTFLKVHSKDSQFDNLNMGIIFFLVELKGKNQFNNKLGNSLKKASLIMDIFNSSKSSYLLRAYAGMAIEALSQYETKRYNRFCEYINNKISLKTKYLTLLNKLYTYRKKVQSILMPSHVHHLFAYLYHFSKISEPGWELESEQKKARKMLEDSINYYSKNTCLLDPKDTKLMESIKNLIQSETTSAKLSHKYIKLVQQPLLFPKL